MEELYENVYLSIYLPIDRSIDQSISIDLLIYIYLSTCPPVYQSNQSKLMSNQSFATFLLFIAHQHA